MNGTKDGCPSKYILYHHWYKIVCLCLPSAIVGDTADVARISAAAPSTRARVDGADVSASTRRWSSCQLTRSRCHVVTKATTIR
jgi:hypothetical protein